MSDLLCYYLSSLKKEIGQYSLHSECYLVLSYTDLWPCLLHGVAYFGVVKWCLVLIWLVTPFLGLTETKVEGMLGTSANAPGKGETSQAEDGGKLATDDLNLQEQGSKVVSTDEFCCCRRHVITNNPAFQHAGVQPLVVEQF